VVGDILQPTHLLFVLVVALIVLGPKRLPEVGRSLGRGLRDFRSALSGDESHRETITAESETITPASETITPASETTTPASAPSAEGTARTEPVEHAATPATPGPTP
jgi:sec-independent protein translocase protein TatA